MSADMTRVQAIWQHPLYQKHLTALTRLEADRIFCRHTPEHFLDVARLTYIFALERNLDCSRELIYCTALLHDIGRAEQYTNGIPHDEAGVSIAGQILSDLNFTEEEKSQILNAIGEHRSSNENLPILSQIIMKQTKNPAIVFYVLPKKNVTGLLRKKI